MSNSKEDLLSSVMNVEVIADSDSKISRSKRASIEKLLAQYKNFDQVAARESKNKITYAQRVQDVMKEMAAIGIEVNLIGQQTEEEKRYLKSLAQKADKAKKEADAYKDANFFTRLFNDGDELTLIAQNAAQRLTRESAKIAKDVDLRMHSPDLDVSFKNAERQINHCIEILKNAIVKADEGIAQVKNALVKSHDDEKVHDEKLTELQKSYDELEAEEYRLRELLGMQAGTTAEMTEQTQQLSEVVMKLSHIQSLIDEETKLLVKAQGAQASFRTASLELTQRRALESAIMKGLIAQKETDLVIYKVRVDSERAAAQMKVSLSLDEALTETSIDNAHQLAVNANVIGEQSLELLSRAADAKSELVDAYKQTKTAMDNIEKRSKKATKAARKNFGIDI